MAGLPPLYESAVPPPSFPATDGEALPQYDYKDSRPFSPFPAIGVKVPSTFRVGEKYTTALVLPSEIQAHLLLLGAFHRLREEVRTQKGKWDVAMQPDEMWAVFLERAVYRFECWTTQLLADAEDEGPERRLTPEECPPLDVMMVWHTYMLNPREYYEDCLRKLPGLHKVGSFPLLQLCATIDPETLLPYTPTERRASTFTSFTGQPFEPPIVTLSTDTVAIFCPNCAFPNNIPWIEPYGFGYAQREFTIKCQRPECQMYFTRETLGVRKFYEDMEKCIVDPSKNFLANTLVDTRFGTPNEELSRVYTGIILGLKKDPRPLRPEQSGNTFGWTFEDVTKICRDGFLGARNKHWVNTPRSLNIVLAAYRHPGPFSLNLCNAVVRQMNFIDKVVNLGWTEPGRFEEDSDTLTRCVVRYHHFLDLLAFSPGRLAVPTLDIDLAWHTHQLDCISYRKLIDFVGVIPDHDDKISQGPLATAYDETAALWKARFGVPYSVCGCLSTTKPESSGGIKSLFSRKGKNKAADPKPIENSRPDLVNIEDMHAEETHPSDHNAVAILFPSSNAEEAEARRQELAKRQKQLDKATEKGKADGWGELQAKRAVDHAPSFLCPVEYGAVNLFGKYGHGDCTAWSGGAVRGAFAPGECAKGSSPDSICGAKFDQLRGGLADAIQYASMMSGDKSTMQQDLGVAQFNASLGGWAASNFSSI